MKNERSFPYFPRSRKAKRRTRISPSEPFPRSRSRKFPDVPPAHARPADYFPSFPETKKKAFPRKSVFTDAGTLLLRLSGNAAFLFYSAAGTEDAATFSPSAGTLSSVQPPPSAL